ncbi:MAG: Gfo/Idh/MocA family oxidoreductase [Armatimonadetes bacterium]|nr:Gfo/Idh/MocA family oxidoreductase [Armatimonadota bacterium]
MEQLSRRTVLAGMAAGPAVLRLGEPQKRKVGWAVLGLGSYAQNQIMPSFKDCSDSKLVALVSGHPEKMERLGPQYGVEKHAWYSYESMHKLIYNDEVDIVYVITPPSTHRGFVEAAAKAGKHVCCEKPMAPSVADCQAMIDAVRKAGKLLQIGYRCHYQAHNMRAVEMCRKSLGKIKSITSDHGFNMGRGAWRLDPKLAGGGSMMDIGIYSLNALRYLSGEEPTTVTAKITNPPGDDRFYPGMEDTVEWTMTVRSGVHLKGTSGYSWQPGKNRFEVVGERGTLFADPATFYTNHRLTLDGKEVAVNGNNQFAAQMDHLSRCVRDGGKVRTPGEEGLRDIRIIHAIYESARTGKTVKL